MASSLLPLLVLGSLCLSYGSSVGPAPSQIHLALGHTPSDMTVSWVTGFSANSNVKYGVSESNLSRVATGEQLQYTVSQIAWGETEFVNSTSPFIHHTTITGLKPSTVYFYQVGDAVTNGWSDMYNFTTADPVGADTPVVFSIIGDLGQTGDSVITRQHVQDDPTTNVILAVGDEAYADCQQYRWDSYFDAMEPLAVSVPWMVVAGNHEIEPSGNGSIMTGYKNRYRMPAVRPGVDNSQVFQKPANKGEDCTPSAFTGDFSYGNSFYSLDIASVHVLFMNSYTRTDAASEQYKWLLEDLAAVDRTVTPWVIALFHSPWYNSNSHHYQEFNTIAMRDSMEAAFFKYGVSAAFNGHVHAYQRSHPVYQNQTSTGGTSYFVIGDGGNREGHATGWQSPDPVWSAFKDDASFGHGRLNVVNATHAQWEWHRNDDDEWKVADSVWIDNAAVLDRMGVEL